MDIINSEMQQAYISHPNMQENHYLAIAMMTEFFNTFKKIFPDRKLPHFIPNVEKDPRKTFIFRCCLCAVEDTKDKITNYHDWVLAQLMILKAIKAEVVITAQCLCGERAWKRWYVWVKFRNKQAKHHEDSKKQEKNLEIVEKIKETHKFLSIKRKSIKDSIEDGTIKWLLDIKKISPYYIILHPEVRKFVKENGWTKIGNDLDKLEVSEIVKSNFFEITKLKEIE